eukprot:s985_g20.t1
MNREDVLAAEAGDVTLMKLRSHLLVAGSAEGPPALCYCVLRRPGGFLLAVCQGYLPQGLLQEAVDRGIPPRNLEAWRETERQATHLRHLQEPYPLAGAEEAPYSDEFDLMSSAVTEWAIHLLWTGRARSLIALDSLLFLLCKVCWLPLLLPSLQYLQRACFGWTREADCFALAFGGAMRIGEVFKTRRKNLIIPEYVAFSQCFTLVQIEEPKTRTRAPRHQAAKVEASDLVRVIATAFARLPPGDFLWAMSPRRLYANVSTSAAYLLQQTEDSELVTGAEGGGPRLRTWVQAAGALLVARLKALCFHAPEPRRRDSFKEKSALLQITRAAQEICLQLSEQRYDESVDGKGSSSILNEMGNSRRTGNMPRILRAPESGGLGRNKKQPRSKQGKKKEVAEEAQIQLEAWCRSTLASVPEADEATKSAAELRKKQLEEMNQADTEAAGEPANSGMDKRSIRPAAEDATGSTAPSPKSRRPVSKQGHNGVVGKKLTQQFSTKWKTLGRDAFYGLPNLQDRLEQIQNTYFGKADMMDEATVQRMRMDDLPHAMEFLGYVVTSEEELNQVAGQVTSFKEMDFNEFLEFVEKYSRAQFDLYQVVFDRFDCDGSGEIEISELRKLLLSIGIVVVRQMIEEEIG